MIDESLYSLENLKRKLGDQFIEGIHDIARKPFYDFADRCENHYENSLYNPKNQQCVYDRNDRLSKAEFQKLSQYDQVQYVLYHRWKKGEIKIEQLRDFNWFEVF